MSFSTIELSNPAWESDGLRMITVRSPALGRRGDITLYVPPDEQLIDDMPALILLHGVYGSHWSWAMSGGAHRICANLIEAGEIAPMTLIMPSDGLWGDGSGYLPHPDADYEKWIIEDVVAATNQCNGAVTSQSPLGIAGLSMGGFGALRLGVKYADRFLFASGHSSITRVSEMKGFVSEDISELSSDPDSCSILAEIKNRLAKGQKLPEIRFDCGVDDSLLSANRELHNALKRMNVPHTYSESDGGHTWDYWSECLPDTLDAFSEVILTQKKDGEI